VASSAAAKRHSWGQNGILTLKVKNAMFFAAAPHLPQTSHARLFGMLVDHGAGNDQTPVQTSRQSRLRLIVASYPIKEVNCNACLQDARSAVLHAVCLGVSTMTLTNARKLTAGWYSQRRE
jgi:hypothetical protein